MAYDVTYNADFNILVTITAPLFRSTDPNIKLDTNATLSLANLVASHINRVYETVPTKVGAATVRLDRAYGSAPIQEFIKEKVANGYIYSARFNVVWEIFGATIDVSSRIDKDQSALDEIKRDLEWELSSDFNMNNILFVTDYDAPKVSVKISDIMIDMNGCPGDDYRFCGSCKRTLSNGLFDDYKITHCPYCGCLLEEPY